MFWILHLGYVSTYAELSAQCGADFWVTVFSCCVFPLRRGGTEAGVRCGPIGMGHRAIFPFRPAVWRQLTSSLFSIKDAILILKMLQSLWNLTSESTGVLLTHLSIFIANVELYQSRLHGFDISRNLKIRYLNSLLDRASTSRVVMLMKTKWQFCSSMKIICLHYHAGRGFQYRKIG